MSTVAVPARMPAPPPRRAVVPNPVLGVALFLFAEVMLFAGLLSAHVVLRSQAGPWPPPGQPRLPVESTAFNTVLLLASGVTLWCVVSAAAAQRSKRLLGLLVTTFALGAAFLALQGVEWVDLVAHGFTGSATLFGSLFTALVGAHALHVAGALVTLGVVLARVSRHDPRVALPTAGLRALRMYWTFVVVAWPPIYVLVYLW